MYDDLGLLVLRLAIGGIVIAHGFIKIGWPISFGNRGADAVRGVAGFFGGLGFWPPMLWAIVSIVAEIGGSLLTVLGLGGPIGPGLPVVPVELAFNSYEPTISQPNIIA